MAFNLIISRTTSRLSSSLASRHYSSSNTQTSKKGLVLGVYTDEQKRPILTPAAEHYNNSVNGRLIELLTSCGSVPGKGKSRTLLGLPGYGAVAVSGLGRQGLGVNELEEIDEGLEAIRAAAAAGCRQLQDLEISDMEVEGLGSAGAAAEGAQLGTWKYKGPSVKKEVKPPPNFSLYHSKDISSWESGLVKARAQNLARRLMDTPGNLMTPTIFANEAAEKLSALGVEVKIHNQSWAESKKMGAFLSVTRGTEEPPKFLELSYKGATADQKPIAFVGKGVTFDSGGISLKPSGKMDEMRADMGGAANVVATFYAAAQLKLMANITGYIPLCENMPSGRATKPGDVVTAMNGKTITVDNTDAEGRLILADALCLASQNNNRLIVDIATLTGAMRMALGGAGTGAFTNCSATWEQLRKAGVVTGDRIWRFPLWNYYTKQISGADQPGSDVNNVGKGGGGGSCTAAAFLKEFAGRGPWVHLDIAGVMSADGKDPSYLGRGMAGRPVRTLVQLVTQLTQSK